MLLCVQEVNIYQQKQFYAESSKTLRKEILAGMNLSFSKQNPDDIKMVSFFDMPEYQRDISDLIIASYRQEVISCINGFRKLL